jgi:hypothetical protein
VHYADLGADEVRAEVTTVLRTVLDCAKTCESHRLWRSPTRPCESGTSPKERWSMLLPPCVKGVGTGWASREARRLAKFPLARPTGRPRARRPPLQRARCSRLRGTPIHLGAHRRRPRVGVVNGASGARAMGKIGEPTGTTACGVNIGPGEDAQPVDCSVVWPISECSRCLEQRGRVAAGRGGGEEVRGVVVQPSPHGAQRNR